jgi:hypothetical protein
MMSQMGVKSYSELILLPTFEERYRYLKLNGAVGVETFGFDRYLNQVFYNSQRWKRVRDHVIIRDNGCDLGVDGYDIHTKILIHHMNPITVYDIENESAFLLDPEFLICTTHNTHNAIHYGDENLLIKAPIERVPNDTCPWRR